MWLAWASLAYASGEGDPTEALYVEHCSVCHGKKGRATFPGVMMGAGSFASESFWEGRPIERLPRAVSLGGEVLGLKSAMPAFGDTLTEEQITALVAYALSLRADKAP